MTEKAAIDSGAVPAGTPSEAGRTPEATEGRAPVANAPAGAQPRDLPAAPRPLATPDRTLHMIGNAHLDPVWLWPWQEGYQEARATFWSAIHRMDEYPDFVFTCDQIVLLSWVEESDPELFARIRERVAEGRWVNVGGWWVEPDNNMPMGESFVRQGLYGQRYLLSRFGVPSTVGMNVDPFGHNAMLPQILRGQGMDAYTFMRPGPHEGDLAPTLFWWEAPDGSRVLAHTFNNPHGGYNGELQPDAYMQTWRNFRGKVDHDTTLLAIGYGDGSGGTTPEMVERELQLRDFPVLPKARWGHIADYFAGAQSRGKEVSFPVWQGEIYLELHRATLTTQSGVKRRHRQAERALITAETVASLAHMLGAPAPKSLEPHWRVVLKNEFHDILPGSSIR